MFRTLTRLIFGGEEENPEEVKSGEVVEEGWLVVNHHETSSAPENQDAELTDSQPPNSSPHVDTVTTMETDISVPDAEPAIQTTSSSSPTISGSFSHPKALAEVTQSTCIQKAKVWADRHHVSRNAIQRQNRVRQAVQHHSFHLQQPGHRNLSH
ncbi:Tumor protein p53-inducible nuclear protein 2 isoform 2 [Scophthalmus maximus]|uniref:Tumor protein p53-inducible nuclear protein 2 n=1 Tax=Scophthalmus maximus TaxID=52904 RepID=A0A2U9BHN0_SCOMX|nr:tumor protein p53-inducible nuclear protein 2 [Scophthalmus maximus]XP_035487688.1 tumor protein p53-inducible nuclear protein 2 [Scophthalmus maximus]AWP03328.1 Tumor protein p53-inducible nuclear protein 2 [Scophthalmus maximus]AWP03329.1 Tumor protein p53-inducible nuclear protein 2 isoform 2 [Scophthalmus maximus]